MELTDFPPEIIEKICSNLSIKDAIEMYNTHNKRIQHSIKISFIDIIKNEEYLDKTTENPKYNELGLKQCIRDQFYGHCKEEDLDKYNDNSYISPDIKTILWNKFKRIAKYFLSHSNEWCDKKNYYMSNYYYAESCILEEMPPEIYYIFYTESERSILKNCLNRYNVKILNEKLKPFSLKEIKYIARFHFVLLNPYIHTNTFDYFKQIKQKIPEDEFLKFLKYTSIQCQNHCSNIMDIMFLIKLIIECDMKVYDVIKEYEKLPVVFRGQKFSCGDKKTTIEEIELAVNRYKKLF